MIIVTGAAGQLGRAIVEELNKCHIVCEGVDADKLDITDSENVMKYICEKNAEAVIHCAAYTAVDKAEEDSQTCTLVNVFGTENIALACKKAGAKMMYISTDYVFQGDGSDENEINSPKFPQCVYGRSKLEGEYKVIENVDKYFIVRTSWVFGVGGNNFVKTMLRISESKTEINVVSDQIGSPTYTVDLATLLCEMVVTEKYGIYHATNEGFCSWAEFAEAIFKKTGKNVKVNFISSSEYPSKAVRPLNSRLSKATLDKAGFRRLPSWQSGLERYLDKIYNREEMV